MGAARSRPAREAPVRYVAKQIPRADRIPVEQQFKKPEFTAQGINRRLEDVNTEPLMYVETSKDASSTELTDHTAPRWYLNTYMEMVDNQRTDQVIISGNLPLSWERDKFEPYALVRGRIDDEDLKWVLAAEQRKKGVDELLPSTKLERNVLQDILDTVELPRLQYRNYKGKLHKTIEDANTHIAARKEQIERAREAEILRKIGYTEQEVLQEEQYLTNRSRGVKSLDDLGASLREKKRRERAAQTNEMEDLLEERRIQELEAGDAVFTEEELLEKPEVLGIKPKPYGTRRQVYKHVYAADFGKDDRNQAKFQWWLDRTRRIKRAVDTIHGVPVYNERLSANEEQTRKQMREAAEFNFALSQAQGAKGFTDPRGHYDEFVSVLRKNKDLNDDSRVEVHEDDVLKNDIFRFPHTKGHGPKPPPRRFTDKGEKPEKVCTDVNRLHSVEEAAQAAQQGVRAAEEVVRQYGLGKEDIEKPVNENMGDITSPDSDPSSSKGN
ncbi:putative dynein heavy chain [Trypanosoma cruzi]|nr:putative dynein heavy chain [Trypanosoma cruzi]